jgi:prepilin-type N-terminal cleavage/methylation domain-containing protein
VRTNGLTLVELLVALVVTGTVSSIAIASVAALRERTALNGASDAVTRQIALTRSIAVARRETVRLTRRASGLAIVDARDRTVATLGVGRNEDLAVDSVRVRPASLRFNARGQAGPGSIYLWRGDRGVRLVVNFLGRVRRESLR